MEILNGKKLADDILKNIKREIKLKKIKPGLAVLLIGEDEASEVYVKIKKKRAREIGIKFSLFKFDEKVSEKEILDRIKSLNGDKNINGIIVQLPLPKKFNTQKIINSINSQKDVDGFGEKNILDPVFPMAIMRLLESSGQKLENKKAIVIANSKLFGEIMLKALEEKKIKGEYILKNDVAENLSKMKEASIVITAVGEKGIIKGDAVRDGVIIVDGGISKEGGKVFGDVDFDSIKNMAGFITPVPGGVGPMTVACLLENVLTAFRNQG